MDDQNYAGRASQEIGIYLSGARRPATLLNLSEQNAQLQLHDRMPIWFGMLVSLLIGDLPSFSGYIRGVDGKKITVAFQPSLHASVVDAIQQEHLSNAATEDEAEF